MPYQNVEIYKGQIVFTPTMDKFEIIENGYIIVNNQGIIERVTRELPIEYQYYSINNFGNKMIMPGVTDLHVHSGQFPNRGLCLDFPLLDWLNECTFPVEAKFKNIDFAKRAYGSFIREMWRTGNLRSVIYDTIYWQSTELLVDMLIKAGMSAFVGKACQDVNVPDYIKENTEQSIADTEKFILATKDLSTFVKPAIYPRFVPSSTPRLLRGLGQLAQKYNTPVISHISESIHEMDLVKKLYPEFNTYGDIYNHYGLLGQTPTVMAHAIYSNEHERKLMKENGVWIGHSPDSNLNLGSGLMPIRIFIDEKQKLGLASDIGASPDIGILEVMSTAIAVSKIVWLMSGEILPHLKTNEAFYLGTKGGGSFFGKVGSFEPGYQFDALIIDDSSLLDLDYTMQERIERFLYIGTPEMIVSRFLCGRYVPEPLFL